MQESPMTPARRMAMGRSNLMARNFLKNLDAGLLVDRTTGGCRGKKFRRVAAPSALTKLARGGSLTRQAGRVD